MIRARLYDGTVLEFEDDTPDDVIERVALQQTEMLRDAEARKPLPAGVVASTAGAGRGRINPPLAGAADPKTDPLGFLGQKFDSAVRDVRDLFGNTVTGASGEVYDARNSADALDRPMPQPPGLTQREMIEGSVAPRVLAQQQAQREVERARESAPQAKPEDIPNRAADFVAGLSDNPVVRGIESGVAGLGKVGTGAVRLAADMVGADRLSAFAGRAAADADIMQNALGRGLYGNDELIANTFNSIVQTAPVVAAGVVEGPAMTTLYGQSFLQQYNDARNAGFSPLESSSRAGIMAAAEVLGERFGFGEQMSLLKGAVRGKPTDEMVKMAGRLLAKEIPGEELTSTIQFAADKWGPAALSPNATVDDYLKTVGDTAKVTVGQTLLMGGGPVALGELARTGRVNRGEQGLPPVFEPADVPAPRIEDMPTSIMPPEQAGALAAVGVQRQRQREQAEAQAKEQTKGQAVQGMPGPIPVPEASSVGQPSTESPAVTPPGWSAFPSGTGTLGVPRAEMPQVKAEHRGPLVNFLEARGVTHEPAAEVPPDSLMPTQAEYSPAKVRQAMDFDGGDRSILVSEDGHVLDGHHQWLAKRLTGEPVKVIQLNAPIDRLLALTREFPSSTTDAQSNAGAAGGQGVPRSGAAGPMGERAPAPIPPGAIGVERVPQGTLAQAAEGALHRNAQRGAATLAAREQMSNPPAQQVESQAPVTEGAATPLGASVSGIGQRQQVEPTAQARPLLGRAKRERVMRAINVAEQANALSATRAGEAQRRQPPIYDDVTDGATADPENIEAAQAFSAFVGRPVMIVRERNGRPTFDATLIDDTIVIEESSQEAPFAVAVHEALHDLDADIRTRVISAVAPTLKNRGAFLQTYPQYRGLSPDLQTEEMVAVLATNEAKTPQFWRRLRDKLGDSDFARLADAIIAAIDRLLAGFRGRESSRWTTNITQVREALTDAYAEQIQRRQGAVAQPRANTQTGADGQEIQTGRAGPVSQGAREDRAARPDQPELRGDVPAAAPVPGRIQASRRQQGDTPPPDGTYHSRTVVGVTAWRELGARRVTTPAEAATATSYLYANAVERFDGLVTDTQGRPLGMVGGFKGALAQTAVYPATVIGEAVRIPGAAAIWFSHNHPSGSSVLSDADRGLYAGLKDAFDGSGIEPKGILAVGNDEFSWTDGQDNVSRQPIPPSSGTKSAPVIERLLAQRAGADRPVIDSPAKARQVARDYYQQSASPGILLLDSQYRAIAWVPLPVELRGPLRGGGLNAIYRAVSEANAGAAILAHGGELDSALGGGTNIGAALLRAGVNTLDIINVATDQSRAERGQETASRTLFSRRQVADPADQERTSLGAFSIDSMMNEEKPDETPEYTDEDIAQELADQGFKVAGFEGIRPSYAPDYGDVRNEEIANRGLMAEDAYPELEYTENADGVLEGYAIIGDTRYKAQVAPRDGGRFKPVFDDQAVNDAFSGGFQAPGVAMASTAYFGDRQARAWNRRFLASADLFTRRFDLLSAVPAPARKRVADLWHKVAKLRNAFEFTSYISDVGASSERSIESVQQIADEALAGTPYTATVEPSQEFHGRSVEVTITDGRKQAAGQIQFKGSARPGQPKQLVMHTQEFERGSGLGKAFYQIAFNFADQLDAIVEADSNGLLGANVYRRTEQMMSAAARSGKAGNIRPGAGQRIYGWDTKASDAKAQERNLVRLALAAARNAAEFVPDVQNWRYDVRDDTFRDSKGRDIEPTVKAKLADPDVRAVSISRSTLARAALTFEAMRRTVKLDDVREVKRPVLYSRRQQPAEDSRESIDQRLSVLRRLQGCVSR